MPSEERSAGREWRSAIVDVITSTSFPRATSRRTSSPAATTGPPKARDGAHTGAAKRMRSGRWFTGVRLVLLVRVDGTYVPRHTDGGTSLAAMSAPLQTSLLV